VVSEAVRLLRASIPAGVRIESSIDPDAPPVLADPTQLHQVLMNLATNAWHALPEHTGLIQVHVGARRVDEGSSLRSLGLRPGPYTCLTVRDNGTGMDPATMERMYEPFFTTKDPGRGSGLGLSVVHGIVSAHEGAIEAESEPGSGTTFRVFLPAATPAPDPVEAPTPTTPRRANGQQVLYLDDEEPLVFLARRLLGRLGYRVEGFTRPEDALAAFRLDPGRFHLVVTDLNMPGCSGLQIAEEVLKIRPEAIVVLSSGHVTEELRRTALQRGIREVIYKPRSVADFSETLHRLVTP
jgi:CheY-like chemotaxis protein